MRACFGNGGKDEAVLVRDLGRSRDYEVHEQPRSIALLFAEVKDWPSVEVKFEVGQAYEINNQKTHSVMNKGPTDRINFIFDYVPKNEKRGKI